jgi:ribosomal-protein-alanine N-acetyltransferase
MQTAGEQVIRPMNEFDIEAVLGIEQISFPVPWKREHFLHEISSPHSYPFVVEISGAVAGYVCLTALFEEAQILDIAVAPSVRGCGAAKHLMNYAIDVARDKAAEVITLEVRASNAVAIALYERLGFRKCGLRARYYDGIEDAQLMEKSLQGDT